MTTGGGLSIFNQYSNVSPLLSSRPSWVSGEDADRIAAYNLYEQIYWTIPQAFKLLQRGSDEDPIYIPSGRQIVDTINRFLCPKMQIIEDQNFGTPAEQELARTTLTSFLRRERFYSKFSTAKREGLFRGDWIIHLYADPTRPEGSRISMFFLDPASYFPIYNPENVDEIIGCHIAEYVVDDKGEPFIRRLTYRKETGMGGPSPITVEDALFKVDKWGGPGVGEGKPEQVLRSPERLPDAITQLPAYHIQNRQQTGTVWGSSELRGMERLMAAINQGISDEEVTLALDGLGVYATDAGTPIDELTNEPTSWNLGPASVVELPDGKKLYRVSGVTNVSPFQDHLKYLHGQIDETAGISQVAKGRVDVQVAESGIALYLELAPTLAVVEEKELIITDVLQNLFYDLRAWFQAYEGINIGEAVWTPKYGDKIPVNRAQRFEELMRMLEATNPVVSAEWVRGELKKIGYELPDELTIKSQIFQETQDNVRIVSDAMGTRLDSELAAQTDPNAAADPALAASTQGA